ncbi:uroporphyrinogen-III synthase [Cereibacter changlensis]|uniref:Uroporphyrinogen-III synthase n=2 Tax=Cereibacter changlensis TaxID=402884 RepID=A0A2T4JXM6_9RHOB|nr:uroporphyrinogen-III synthase [Cereibacter changlensis]PTE22664.1 uroporphyrinogen-III synthase [Cereibacter changlensis JA139]PZX58955.1 uroporphyrinogen-III synthase [Cereibacter changlensis]
MASQSRQPFLLTRPARQGARFAAALRQRFGEGIRLVTSPLLAPLFLRPELPAGAATLIFTSETGVEAFRRISAEQPQTAHSAWCVGERTAEAARAAGLSTRSADGDAEALVAQILAAGEAGPLLHLRGAETRGEVAKQLTEEGIPATEAVVYDQRPQPLSDEALALLQGPEPVIAPLFSPRTAALLAGELRLRAPGAPLWVAALSPAVAAAAAPLQPARSQTAAHPDAASLIAAIVALIDAESPA